MCDNKFFKELTLKLTVDEFDKICLYSCITSLSCEDFVVRLLNTFLLQNNANRFLGFDHLMSIIRYVENNKLLEIEKKP